MASPTDPSYLDPDLFNPRALRLVDAFKDALARLRDEHGLTYDDLDVVATLLSKVVGTTGAPLAFAAVPLFSEIFQGGQDGYTPGEDFDSPTHTPGAPLIGNPGTLSMRPDEPGVPLIVSGRVLDGHGHPLAGVELDIYHASDAGVYSGMFDDGQPKYNLRGRQLTDAEGRYHFTTITPAPYPAIPGPGFEDIARAAAAIGRSFYRPAHIHYVLRHPGLVAPWQGEVYFSGDPVIPVDFVGPKYAHPALRATTVLHDDPKEIAEHGFQDPFNTAEFDFILKTHTSPDTVAPPEKTA